MNREAFEKWYEEDCGFDVSRCWNRSVYQDPDVENDWQIWQAALSQQEAAFEELYNDDYCYASRIATALHEKHWSATSPALRLLPTLSGVLSQIDNMTCSLVTVGKQQRRHHER